MIIIQKKRTRIDDTGFCVNALEFTIQDIVGGGGGGEGGVGGVGGVN